MSGVEMSALGESLRVVRFRNAEFFASELFRECFGIAFPIPRENCGLPIPTPPDYWWQYVAFYKWSETRIEPVGFLNWIRYIDLYLGGGMCVRASFYRRLPKSHLAECRERGGLAQIMLETSFRELDDCLALFGYCGDKRSHQINLRAGYVPTRTQYVLARWMADISQEKKDEMEARVAAIGLF